MEKGENALVAWLASRFAADEGRVVLGIGDDMAVLRVDGPLVAITADMLLDGVHFDTAHHTYEQIGRKAMACSLSDCAAMACEPRGATVSLALPSSMNMPEVQRLYEGMAGICERFGCPIVGGDTTSWPGRLAIDVSMLGKPMSPARGPICRSTGRVGDTIFVSGCLGGSLLGKHMDFTPRLDLARELITQNGLHAMMDLSDGLSMDLHRLCRASKCAAILEAEAIDAVASDAARQVSAADGKSPRDHALSDGEDFELLIAGDASLGSGPWRLQAVGKLVACEPQHSGTMRIRHRDGREEPLEPLGYEHFR